MDFFQTFGQAISKVKEAVKNFTDVDAELKKELARCEIYAAEGYQIAYQKYLELQKNLSAESQRLADANVAQNQVGRIKNTALIREQTTELSELKKEVNAIGEGIVDLHESQRDFSIVVYGRTMAGKSTLMEILTRGNGKSIGKGDQRTTRDVRSYYWNGLKITDVPGICAFEGKEDERLAEEAAKSADLILFLITNDAPQADEAAALAKLKSFGKPILGLINVKSEFNLDSPDWDLNLEDFQEKLANTANIDDIIRQFKAFGKKHNQDWSDINFVATHLLSAYQAHPCRGHNKQVYEASQFAQVEKFILEKIISDGRFLRIKTFIDAVAVPMNKIILKVYEHSANALIESAIWQDKKNQLNEWRNGFKERSHKKFAALHDKLAERIKSEIESFADNNYENENAGQAWKNRFEFLRINQEYQKLLKELAKECERKLKDLSDELTHDIRFNFQSGVNVKVDDIESTTPVGEYVGGGLAAVGSIAGIAFPPLGIALGVIGLLTGIFSESRDEKIRKNKQKLRDAVTKPSFEILGKIHTQAIEIFNTEILSEGVKGFYNLLNKYQFMLANLGNSQRIVASKLAEEFISLNKKFLEEAVNYKGIKYIPNIAAIARVPGEMLMLTAIDSNFNKKSMSNLIGEKIVIKPPQLNFKDTLEIFLGCKYGMRNYPLFNASNSENDNVHAIIPDEKIPVLNFKLAQQIAFLPIITR